MTLEGQLDRIWEDERREGHLDIAGELAQAVDAGLSFSHMYAG